MLGHYGPVWSKTTSLAKSWEHVGKSVRSGQTESNDFSRMFVQSQFKK